MIFRFVTGLRHMPWPGVSWRSGVLLAGVLLISVSCSGDNLSADKGSRADRVFVIASAWRALRCDGSIARRRTIELGLYVTARAERVMAGSLRWRGSAEYDDL